MSDVAAPKSAWKSKTMWINVAIAAAGAMAGAGALPGDVIPSEASVPAISIAVLNVVLRLMSKAKLVL